MQGCFTSRTRGVRAFRMRLLFVLHYDDIEPQKRVCRDAGNSAHIQKKRDECKKSLAYGGSIVYIAVAPCARLAELVDALD